MTGPSGAGKDSVIAAARAALIGDPDLIFPRRIVTRPPSDGEDHASLTASDFTVARSRGAFALHWEAHGLCYGIPAGIIDDLNDGRTVICNVSRAVVAEARSRFTRVVCIEITAPKHILRARLQTRNRENAADIEHRLVRTSAESAHYAPDEILENSRTLDEATQAFLAFVRA